MDFQRLRVFQAVAEEGSFSAAARVLFLSQPGVTQHVHALEAELGVPLFDRFGRRIALTPAGAALATQVPQILGLVAAAEVATREAGGEASRTLRLGVSETLATYVLPPLLGQFQQALPGAELRLVVGDSSELVPSLLNNDFELAFWLQEAQYPQLEQVVLASEPLVWIMHPGEPRARSVALPADAFQDRRLILRTRNSAARRVIESLLIREGARPDVVLEMDNLEAIKRAVEVDFGVSITPRSAAEREAQQGILATVPLAAEGAFITSSYARYAGRRLSAPAQVFVRVLNAWASSIPQLAGRESNAIADRDAGVVQPERNRTDS